MFEEDHETPNVVRRCAQIKQRIRLSKCEHSLVRKLSDQISYCIDCDQLLGSQAISCEHPESDLTQLSVADIFIEYCKCGKVTWIYEP